MKNNNGHKTLKAYRPQRVNANKHTPIGLRELRNSIGKYGIADAITVAADGESLSGSARLETLAEIMPGVKIVEVETDGNTLIVNKRTDIPNAKSKRGQGLSAAVNIIQRLDYNPDGEILAALAAEDEMIAGLVKAEQDSLRAVQEYANANGDADAEPQMDRAEELNKKWKVKRGDLWRIGEHRLLCGDSTVRADVERVMDGEKASILFTSPPYPGFSIWNDLSWGQTIDEQHQWLKTIYCVGLDYLLNDGQVFINISDNSLNQFNDWHTVQSMKELGFELRQRIIWHKNGWIPAGDNARPPLNYEFVLWFVRNGKIGKYLKGQAQNANTELGIVWSIPWDRNRIHGASFPKELACGVLIRFSQVDEIVFEPFCGSGTTLVACQNLSRRCRAIEISPAYTAVCLERMCQAFPNIEIERIP